MDALVAETANGLLGFHVGQFPVQQLGISSTQIGRYPVVVISDSRRGFMPMQPLGLDITMPLKLSIPAVANSLRPKNEDAIRDGEIIVERTIAIDSLSAGLEFVNQADWSSILPCWICLTELGNERLTVNPIVSPALRVDVSLNYPSQRSLSRPAQMLYEYFAQELKRSEEERQRITLATLSNS